MVEFWANVTLSTGTDERNNHMKAMMHRRYGTSTFKTALRTVCVWMCVCVHVKMLMGQRSLQLWPLLQSALGNVFFCFVLLLFSFLFFFFYPKEQHKWHWHSGTHQGSERLQSLNGSSWWQSGGGEGAAGKMSFSNNRVVFHQRAKMWQGSFS